MSFGEYFHIPVNPGLNSMNFDLNFLEIRQWNNVMKIPSNLKAKQLKPNNTKNIVIGISQGGPLWVNQFGNTHGLVQTTLTIEVARLQ